MFIPRTRVQRVSVEEGRLELEGAPPPDGLYRLVRDRAEEARRLRKARELYEQMRRTDPGGDIRL